MNIPLHSFVKFATYDGALEPCSLVNHPEIAEAIKADLPNDSCYLQEYAQGIYQLWSMRGWMQELKRLKDMESIPRIAPKPDLSIDEQIKQAVNKGNMNLAMQLLVEKGKQINK